jgi:hypothetical protein
MSLSFFATIGGELEESKSKDWKNVQKAPLKYTKIIVL